MADLRNDRGPRAGTQGPDSGHTTTPIVPTPSDVAELIDVLSRAGTLFTGLSLRLADGRADLPLAVEQLAELTRDVLVAVARTTEAVDR